MSLPSSCTALLCLFCSSHPQLLNVGGSGPGLRFSQAGAALTPKQSLRTRGAFASGLAGFYGLDPSDIKVNLKWCVCGELWISWRDFCKLFEQPGITGKKRYDSLTTWLFAWNWASSGTTILKRVKQPSNFFEKIDCHFTLAFCFFHEIKHLFKSWEGTKYILI